MVVERQYTTDLNHYLDSEEIKISDKTKLLLSHRDDIHETVEKNLALISIEPMHPDFFAGAYYSLMTKYRD